MSTHVKTISLRLLIILLISALVFTIPLSTIPAVNADSGASISLDKTAKVDGSLVEVDLDLSLKSETFTFDTPKDYIFIVHSTGSSNSWPNTGKIDGRKAIVQAIKDVWEKSPSSTVTIVAFGRAAFETNADKGLSYDYEKWSWDSQGRIIGNSILGYIKLGGNAPGYELKLGQEQLIEKSFYNELNYYRLTKSEYLNKDSVSLFDQWKNSLSTDESKAVSNNSPSGDYISDAVYALPYADDTNTEAGFLEASRLLKTKAFQESKNPKEIILMTTGQANRSFADSDNIYISPAVDGKTKSQILNGTASSAEINQAANKANNAATAIKNTGAKVSVIALDATPQPKTALRDSDGTAWTQDQVDSEFLKWSSGNTGAGSDGNASYFNNTKTAPMIFNNMNQTFTQTTQKALPLPVLVDSVNSKDFGYVSNSADSTKINSFSIDSRTITVTNNFIKSAIFDPANSKLKFNFNENAISNLTSNTNIRIAYNLKPKDPSILNTAFTVGDSSQIEFGFITPTLNEETGEVTYNEEDFKPVDVSDINVNYVKPKSGKYTLTLNANGGKIAGKKTYKKTVVYGKKYSSLKKPTRKGYVFKGWYTKKKGGTKITANSIMKYKKDVTLYAHWSKNGKMKKTVYIHKGAGNSSKVIGAAYKGDKVCILKMTKTGWYKIKAGNKTGFIYKRYIKKLS